MITTPGAASNSDPSLRFGPAIYDVFEIMRAELGERMTSVLVGGSASRNNAHDGSDVDVFVTFDGDWRQRRRFDVRTKEVDLFINPTPVVRSNILHGRDAVLVYNYADGWPIFDPYNIIDELQALAKNVWANPRQAPTDLQIFVLANKMRDALASIRRAFGAERSHEAYLMCDFVESAIAAYYAFTRRWRPPQKLLIAELKSVDPYVAEQIAIALDQQLAVDARRSAVTSLYEVVVAKCESARGSMTGPKIRVSK